ncbi:unnamed protein product, partial [marine sediment metagenome]
MTHPKYILVKDPEYLKWIREQGCAICGAPSEPHHMWHSGGALCNDNLAVPLCREHHTDYHQMGIETWGDARKLFIV